MSCYRKITNFSVYYWHHWWKQLINNKKNPNHFSLSVWNQKRRSGSIRRGLKSAPLMDFPGSDVSDAGFGRRSLWAASVAEFFIFISSSFLFSQTPAPIHPAAVTICFAIVVLEQHRDIWVISDIWGTPKELPPAAYLNLHPHSRCWSGRGFSSATAGEEPVFWRTPKASGAIDKQKDYWSILHFEHKHPSQSVALQDKDF